MSCCGGGNRHVTIYQVRTVGSNTVKRYGTEGEAWAAAKALNKAAPGSATVEVKKTK